MSKSNQNCLLSVFLMMAATDDDAGSPIAELCSTCSLFINSFATFQKEAPNYTARDQTYGILSIAVIILTSLKWYRHKILQSGLTEASTGCAAAECMP